MVKIKKSIPIIALLLLSFTLQAKITKSTNGLKTIYDVEIEGVNTSSMTVEGVSFNRLTLKGIEGHQGIMYKRGYPEVPAVRFYVRAKSANDINVSFSSNKSSIAKGQLGKELIPNLDSLPKIRGSKRKIIRDKSMLKFNGFWPLKRFSVTDAGSIRGEKRQLVSIYPLSYNPVTRSYKLIKKFNVEVNETKVASKSDMLEGFAIIVGKRFKNSNAVTDYINFKKSMGFNVVKIVVGEGVNTPNQIRAKLQDLLANNNLRYAFVIGDLEHVPAHDASNISGNTDHFYRAIDTSDYESDINGPDIGVGRITFKDENQLSGIIKKLIKYQKGLFSTEDWLMDVSFIATDDRFTVAEGSHNYAIENYMVDFGYEGIFPNANQAGGDRLYAITHRVSDSKVVNTMNLGRTLINYSGHGSQTSWAGPSVSQRDVRGLDHIDANPFVISNACVTAKFSRNESFGETWIRHPQGAILFWGSFVNSLWDEDDILERAMYDSIYDLGYLNFNKITQHSLTAVWIHYNGAAKSKYYWETYANLGDASVRFRSTNVRDVVVEGTRVVPIGTTDFNFIISDDNGNSIKNARVALILDGDPIAFEYSNETGEVSFSTNPITDFSDLRLNVYGDNTKFKSTVLNIISPDTPFLVLNNFRSNGESRNIVTPKEDLIINFTVKNVSSLLTSGGSVEIESIVGPATKLTNNLVNVPALEGDASFNFNGNNFGIKINDGADQEKIAVVLRWRTNEGESRTIKRIYKLSKGHLETVSVDFGDINNPMVGGFGSGNSGEIYLTVKNNGSGVIENAVLAPVAGNCVAEVTNSLEISLLNPGQELRLATPVWVKLNNDCAAGEFATVNINGSYGRDLRLATPAKFIIGVFGSTNYSRGSLNIEIKDNMVSKHNFEVQGVAAISKISLHIKLTHSYVGDLTIRVVHPSGKSITLREKSGGSNDDLDQVFGEGGTAVEALSELKGLSAAGTWRVEVEDSGRGDTGKLNFVSMEIFGLM